MHPEVSPYLPPVQLVEAPLKNRKGRKERKEKETFASFAFFAVDSIQPHRSHICGGRSHPRHKSYPLSENVRRQPRSEVERR